MMARFVAASDNTEKGWLERTLSLFAPVRAGEGASALLLASNVFLLLAAYYILKTVRESLILTEGGAEVKSYSAAGQALLLLLVVPAYGAFASKVSRMRLIFGVTLFFICNLLIFALLGGQGVPVGVAFFLWVGIFNVLIIAQFWSFANDVYTEEQGKRLFAIVGVGSSLGAWVGAYLAGVLFSRMGPFLLMLVSAAMLLACIGFSFLVNRREALQHNKETRKPTEPLGKQGGFRMVLQNRYLLLIALLIVILNVVNTTGEFLLGSLVVDAADRAVGLAPDPAAFKQAFIGQFYGDFFSWVNLLGFLFQLFLVSRIFKYIGVRGALFILPCIAFGAYTLLAFLPVLGVVRIAKMLENSTDYSIQNTARHALFLPTSREAKYKAKAAIDTFFWRAGDVLQAVVVFVGTQLAFTVSHFALFNILLVMVWIGVVGLIYREHRKLTETREERPERADAIRRPAWSAK
jgi:AAA family ATP:ADP antiporter